MKQHRYSECFRSIQGEGQYIGTPSVFLRLWGCNFTCSGFKCDTEYSWHRDFQHLSKRATAEELCAEIESFCPSFDDTFHLVITGGEPMLSQTAITEILDVLTSRKNLPGHVTIETNGTQSVREDMAQAIHNIDEWLWSVSPKLSLSGESWADAIQPDIVAEYATLSDKGQLKYVVDGSTACWDEVETATEAFRNAGVGFPVWIMPVGATPEQQAAHQERICLETVARGYSFSPRAHAWIFGDRPGT